MAKKLTKKHKAELREKGICWKCKTNIGKFPRGQFLCDKCIGKTKAQVA